MQEGSTLVTAVSLVAAPAAKAVLLFPSLSLLFIVANYPMSVWRYMGSGWSMMMVELCGVFNTTVPFLD